jgi:NAD(P)-dependent dehydrogenase (short-subunit alcohol dehydrogenase family)
LIVVDVGAGASEALVAELQSRGTAAEARTVDLADRDALAAFATDLLPRRPRIDVLFNNAGAVELWPLDDFDDDHRQRMIDISLRSAFVLIRAVLPARRSASESVINNASVHGVYGHPSAPVYSGAKGGMLTLTRALATTSVHTASGSTASLPVRSTRHGRSGGQADPRRGAPPDAPAPRRHAAGGRLGPAGAS